ncbi:unnamed protein product [Dovyalis caffra]|uniref:Uncharacterized protein n=1 Tax=Dovyalis caffra TaxID=77055 RepID=A0AAV1QSY8_9ROSI|nr:unnamed protein product [Dovyalis caffra]
MTQNLVWIIHCGCGGKQKSGTNNCTETLGRKTFELNGTGRAKEQNTYNEAHPHNIWKYQNLSCTETWPISACVSTTCVISPEEIFTIHGLWPVLKDGTAVTDCSPERFNRAGVRVSAALSRANAT